MRRAEQQKSDDPNPDEEKKRKRSTMVVESQEQTTQSDRFCAYYCFACGSFAMAVEGHSSPRLRATTPQPRPSAGSLKVPWTRGAGTGLLHTMPRRKTDAATAVPKGSAIKNVFKRGAAPPSPPSHAPNPPSHGPTASSGVSPRRSWPPDARRPSRARRVCDGTVGETTLRGDDGTCETSKRVNRRAGGLMYGW